MLKRIKSPNARFKWLRLLATGLIVTSLVLVAVLVIVPAAFPATAAGIADFLRSVFGPEPVAKLESLSFWLKDEINRSLYAALGGKPQISWPDQNQADVNNLARTSASAPQPTGTEQAETGKAGCPLSPIPPIVPATPTSPVSSVVDELPQIGWQAYGPKPRNIPLMARTLLMVDPVRSYAGVALVRIDLSQLQLHIMPGFIEPAHPSGIGTAIPNAGSIPLQDQEDLVAAFNGGFKAIHGHYGMMVNRFTLLQPVEGMATVAVYQDGSVHIGAWGSDITLTPELLAYRQNCAPLIQAGQINPALSTAAHSGWGFTNHSDITWRTGLGITQDGRYLIYAVGNGTDAKFLAEALHDAGAYNAMQLDINQYYAQFVFYTKENDPAEPATGPWIAQSLLDQMIDDTDLYLAPSPRDFFYLTLR